MQTTTPRLIRADFSTQIMAIEPLHPDHQTSRFRPVRSVSNVRGPELRNFHLEIPEPAQPVEGGIYGSGVEFLFTLHVWVCYGHLSEEDDDSIITTDGAQIWDSLQSRYDPALPGLISVEPTGWIAGDDDSDGHRWGAHTFEVRYLQDV
ncbi:MAG: hypothetical protein IPN32_39145 [Deltaproteobacteria bacterium]|nr:hypothetical protein [Deltaproteobacteria bacterium]